MGFAVQNRRRPCILRPGFRDSKLFFYTKDVRRERRDVRSVKTPWMSLTPKFWYIVRSFFMADIREKWVGNQGTLLRYCVIQRSRIQVNSKILRIRRSRTLSTYGGQDWKLDRELPYLPTLELENRVERHWFPKKIACKHSRQWK